MRTTTRAVFCLSVLSLSCSVALGAPSFDPELQPTGHVASPDVTNYDVTSGQETMFVPDYDRQLATGNLNAFPVGADGSLNRPAERWSGGAAGQLITQNWSSGRVIATMKSNGSPIPFRWTSLSATQQAAIDSDATRGAAILAYVRGDRANESPNGLDLRPRAGVLGDIMHSRPIFVDGARPIVYVGANDGMLHAFDAANGKEVFAYIPSMLLPKLKALSAPTYMHNYYVDGGINVGELVGSSTEVLVASLGAGGRGLFALNVTNPVPTSESDLADKVLWEITNTTVNNTASSTYANLGYTYAEPFIAPVSNGGSTVSAVIVPNGYNNTGNGQASLFVINAADGSLIREISTGSGSLISPNGLSTATPVDMDSDGKLDRLYAGDLDGNLWRFDLSAASPGAWSATRVLATSPAQAITSAPAVSTHPGGGVMVTFATGKIFVPADVTDTSTHYVYGAWDGAPAANTSMLTQTLAEANYPSTGAPNAKRVRVATANVPNWASGGHKGWRVALPAGERVVGDRPFVANRRFYFNSTNPTLTHTAPIANGDNWLMELNYLTGGSAPSPVFDLSGDGEFTDADRISSGGAPITGPNGVPIGKFELEGVGSQPILLSLATLSTTYINSNADLAVSPPPPASSGLTGGHFDFDIYYGQPCAFRAHNNGCQNNTHIHEYSDQYSTTGVNMLNPSNASHRLSNAIPSTSTQFKVLLANQSFSPAVWFTIGGQPWQQVTQMQTSPGLAVSALPTYTRADITTLMWTMPLDALSIKDWSGTGVLTAGLVPTKTGCVRGNDLGPLGEWRNGALTVQVIRADTPNTAIQWSSTAGAQDGYRLKNADLSYLLAEYTIFWHYSGSCFHNPSWTRTPTQSPVSTASIMAPASIFPPGDPSASLLFVSGGASLVSTTVTTTGATTTTVLTYSNGTTITEVRTQIGNGRERVTVTIRDATGSRVSERIDNNSQTQGDEKMRKPRNGRVSWRELRGE